MRRPDPEPEVLATLEAIDATLADEPVDPEFAEIAELALLVRAERPAADAEFADALDRRVQERFRSVAGAPKAPPPKTRKWWLPLAPAGGLIAAAVVAWAVLSSGGGAPSGVSFGTRSLKAPSIAAPRPRGLDAVPSLSQNGGFNSPNQSLAPSPGLHVPNGSGRKVTESSQLTLGVIPKRIETVAQEVFNVTGTQNGFVKSSQVNAATGGGYAHFLLAVPSVSLPQTMTELSRLSYANVLSRTDLVEDLTSQFRTATRHHNKKELRALQRKVAYSEITVNVEPAAPPPPTHPRHHDAGFITNSAHTALHVLTVIAGVGLIVVAVLVPLGLVVAALWGLADMLRRRRRERALDLA